MFFNSTFDFIMSIVDSFKGNFSSTQLLKKLLAIFIFSPFYILAAFGNGRSSSKEIFDNAYFNNGIGGLAALSFLPSAIMSISGLVDKLWAQAETEEHKPLLDGNNNA